MFSVQVQNRQNFDVIWLCEEVRAVRKVAEESTVNVAFDTRELSRIVLDTLEHQVEFVKEPRAQADRWSSYHTAAAWMSRSD